MKRIVLTGGPGAGKTAVLEVIRRHFCEHVVVLPEAAGILFGGGFPRGSGRVSRCAAQRAIYHVQVELERMQEEVGTAKVLLCDRGTLDGLAYWPTDSKDFLTDVHTTLERELARYEAVIHLRTPPTEGGYNHDNPLRTESAREAATIDEKIAAVWSPHPRRLFVRCTGDFLDKVEETISLLRAQMPACCPRPTDVV